MLIKVKALKAHDIYRRGAVYERELDVATASLIVNGYLLRTDVPLAPIVEESGSKMVVGETPLANPRRSRARNPLRAEQGGDQLDQDAQLRPEQG